MSYISDALALSPDACWRLGESSGTTLADATGNGRDATFTAGVTLGAAGAIAGDADTAITMVSGTLIAQAPTVPFGSWMNRSTFTAFIWFKTTDTGTNYVLTRWGSSSGQLQFGIALQPSNVIQGYARVAGSTRRVEPTVTGLRDGNYHMAAVTYDGSEVRLVVDGVQQGTPIAISGTLNAPASNGITIGHQTAASSGDSFEGQLDEPWFGPVLTNAQVAALYQAGLGNIQLSGDPFVSSATALDGSAQTQILVAGDPFVSAATMLDGSISDTPVVVSGEAFSVAATALDGVAQTQVLVGGDPFVSSATALDGSPALGPVGGDPFVVTMTMLDGGIVATSTTDTSNFYNGRRRFGSAEVEVDVPVVAPPVPSTVTRVDKAIAFPDPVLVKGRPT